MTQVEGIHDSKIFEPKRLRTAPPLVVRREHLDSGLWKSDRSFAITLLFNTISLAREDQAWTLSIDLRNQSCAIYSNRGKEFLRSKFVPNDPMEYYICSQETHAFLLGAGPGNNLTKHIRGLRWASGGFLPVAWWRNRPWVCLFFRDIEPVGWNLANGASETKDEYKDLDLLIFREMLEELVICRGTPAPHAHVTHLIPQVPGPRLRRSVVYAPKLTEKHADLRFQHDNVHFEFTSGPDLLPRHTPERVKVTYHDRWRRTLSATTENVLISINPLELGAEVVRVGEFTLGESDRLLDGEVHHAETGDYLVRAPIALLSVDFLKEVYRNSGGTLGRPVREHATDDRRAVDNIEHSAFHIFADDIPLRASRLSNLDACNLAHSAEAVRLRRWENFLQPKFIHAQSKDGTLADELAFLLPVVWKTLEQAFKHGVL